MERLAKLSCLLTFSTMVLEKVKVQFYWKVNLHATNRTVIAIRQEFSNVKIEFSARKFNSRDR